MYELNKYYEVILNVMFNYNIDISTYIKTMVPANIPTHPNNLGSRIRLKIKETFRDIIVECLAMSYFVREM